MMNDGEETPALSDITGGQKPDSIEEHSVPEPEAAAAATSEAAEEEEPTLSKKIVNVAEAVVQTTVKVTHEVVDTTVRVTSEVATKVAHAGAQAYDSTQNAVRRMSKKPQSDGAAPDGDEAEGDAPQEEASAAAATDSEADQPKESIWGKVRRASGTAALKAAGAAQAAYKAAEPVGHRVADGAKTAFEKAKPVAETAVHKTSEGAVAAWEATKEGTMRAVHKVRTMSGAQMPSTSTSAADEPSLEKTIEDPDVGEITSSGPAAVDAEVDSGADQDENN